MSTQTGRAAETLAATHLTKLKLRVISQNWRNRWCEIDLIAVDQAGAVHFVEVKYRRYTDFGSGFDYITRDKADRLERAATFWMSQFGGHRPFQVDVISITGGLDKPELEYLPNALVG